MQQRQREAQQHAQGLAAAACAACAAPQRDHGQRQVREGRAVQQQGAGQAVPELLRDAARALGQVRRGICPANG